MRSLSRFLSTLVRCFFCWRVRTATKDELAHAEVVLGQSFGLRSHDPGPSNAELARIAHALSRQHQTPLILQWEISDALVHPTTCAGVVREHRIRGRYLDTYEVLSQSAILCRSRGWKRAIVLAHPDHAWRVVRTAERLGFTAVAADTGTVPYDPKSIQPWTRRRASFIPRELVARLLYLVRGWI